MTTTLASRAAFTPGILATLSQKRHELKFAPLRIPVGWTD
jgi:hypothetical protein